MADPRQMFPRKPKNWNRVEQRIDERDESRVLHPAGTDELQMAVPDPRRVSGKELTDRYRQNQQELAAGADRFAKDEERRRQQEYESSDLSKNETDMLDGEGFMRRFLGAPHHYSESPTRGRVQGRKGFFDSMKEGAKKYAPKLAEAVASLYPSSKRNRVGFFGSRKSS